MTWNDPLPAPNDGDTPTHTDLNKYLANMEDLNGRALAKGDFTEWTGSNISTTSTAWISIDSSFEFTITTDGEDVFVLLAVVVSQLHIDIDVDGTRLGNATSGEGVGSCASALAVPESIFIPRILNGLSAGSHTIKGVMKITSGTGTVIADHTPRMYVIPL